MSILTAAKADKIDRINPDTQDAGLGTEVKILGDYAPVIITYNCPGAAHVAAGLPITVPFGFEILDVIIQARASNGSGTYQIRKGTTAITNAIACDTDKAIARAASIDDAYSTIAVGDDLNVKANGTGDIGLVTIIAKRA
jgi:hypothetical protein